MAAGLRGAQVGRARSAAQLSVEYSALVVHLQKRSPPARVLPARRSPACLREPPAPWKWSTRTSRRGASPHSKVPVEQSPGSRGGSWRARPGAARARDAPPRLEEAARAFPLEMQVSWPARRSPPLRSARLVPKEPRLAAPVRGLASGSRVPGACAASPRPRLEGCGARRRLGPRPHPRLLGEGRGAPSDTELNPAAALAAPGSALGAGGSQGCQLAVCVPFLAARKAGPARLLRGSGW